jgi:pyruvate formate lyase activating enzyme
MTNKPVQYYENEDTGDLRCLVCPHHCSLKEGQRGICRVRHNKKGQLVALNYGEVSSLALDPIEKKPLYHFYPGSMILSAGSWGCNLKCPFCQNYSIAHQLPVTRYINADELVEISMACREQGSIGLAFTYNEPFMWLENIMEVGPRLHEQGLKVVLVSNGYIEIKPLEDMLSFVDAFNIDLKGFTDRFYQHLCMGKLEVVQKTLATIVDKAHLEITNLLIPGENDKDEEIKSMCRWLADLDPGIVLHFSRYHPAYKMSLPPTPEKTLQHAADIARGYLKHVFLGNLPGGQNDSLCPHCGKILIRRTGYEVDKSGLIRGKCSNCGEVVPYIVDYDNA